MIKTEEFDKWFADAKSGDKIIYYRGSIARQTENISTNENWAELRELRDHVMGYCAIWFVEAKTCTLQMLNKVCLFQKKIQKYVPKSETPDNKSVDEIYEYIAVKN